MRLTIVLVTYNSMRNVVDLVSAVRALTVHPHELIIVDNASTDGTREYLRLFRTERNVRLIENETNRACAAATNQALALATTEYVVFLCANHALVTRRGWDEELLRFMDTHPELLIAGDTWNPYGFTLPSKRYKPGWTPEGHGRERLLHVQGGAWIARRCLFERFGGFAEDEYPQGGMDVELCYRLLSHGEPLGQLDAIACPPSPEEPALAPGVCVYHPASDEVRREARRNYVSSPARRDEAPAAIVFCERIDNESFCESVIRELGAYYEVRPCGPGWAIEKLEDVPLERARFYLELDPASGNFHRPEGLARLPLPKFAWLIDTHKKPAFHAQVAQEMDLTFFAMKNWGHVFRDRPAAWLPLHADTTIFRPREVARDIDVAFVGSYGWRAGAIVKIGKRHGLRVHVSCTTGTREKTETAAIYARSKIVFNRHVTNDLNFRMFEATACGRVLLTDAQWNGQYELFEEEKHFVAYKDERDLERLILELLGDEERRARIEREAAVHAERHHSTRARVRQLRDEIEDFICPRFARTPHPGPLPAPPAPRGEGEGRSEGRRPRRLLVFADGDRGVVSGKTYAERLAAGLVKRGHEVVLAREKVCALAVPGVLELEVGPLPDAPAENNRRLRSCAALHARLARAVRDMGDFDVIVGEGPRGALVAQPLAARRETPFVLALRSCEVVRRGNRLTREQLYCAELEHWGVGKAQAVIAASATALAGARKHYGFERARLILPPALERVRVSEEEVSELLGRLGLPAERELVIVLGTLHVRMSGASLVAIDHDFNPTGRVLRALASRAKAVVALDRDDPRLGELGELGLPIAFARGRSLEDITAAADHVACVSSDNNEDGLAELEELVDEILTPDAAVLRVL